MKTTYSAFLIAVMILMAGCSSVPEPVMPSGGDREPVNSEARIEDYKFRTAEDVANYRERTALSREVKGLTDDINTLKTYIVMKEMAEAANKPPKQTAADEDVKASTAKKGGKGRKTKIASATTDKTLKTATPSAAPVVASADKSVSAAATSAAPVTSAQQGKNQDTADTKVARPSAAGTVADKATQPDAKAASAAVTPSPGQPNQAAQPAEPELDAQTKLARMCAALDAQVEAQTNSGKQSAFTLARGLSIQQQIERWASSVGWNVDWNVADSWIVPGDKPYGDDFAKAAQCAVYQLSQNGADVLADVWTGNRLVVVHQQTGVAE